MEFLKFLPTVLSLGNLLLGISGCSIPSWLATMQAKGTIERSADVLKKSAGELREVVEEVNKIPVAQSQVLSVPNLPIVKNPYQEKIDEQNWKEFLADLEHRDTKYKFERTYELEEIVRQNDERRAIRKRGLDRYLKSE